MEKLASKKIVKIGIVVHDIEEVAKRYANLFDIPTPEVRYPDPHRIPPKGAYKRYKGKDYQVLLKCTHIDLDPIYLEILEPYDHTPSPWLDHLEKFGPSVCFLSFYINGFRQQIDLMEQQGYAQIFEEEKGPERYAYFDTLQALGITLELKERDVL